MAYVARKIPFVGTPDTNPETKPFFEGAGAGKLMVRRCTSCKKAHHYPARTVPVLLRRLRLGSRRPARRRSIRSA